MTVHELTNVKKLAGARKRRTSDLKSQVEKFKNMCRKQLKMTEEHKKKWALSAESHRCTIKELSVLRRRELRRGLGS